MMRRVLSLAIFLFGLGHSASSQDVNSILENHLKSWGQEELLSVRTVQLEVMEVKGLFNKTKYLITRKRPNKVRLDEVWEEKPVITCFDGRRYWADVPWHVSDEPYEVLDTEKAKLDNSIDVDSPLFKVQKDSTDIEYLELKLSNEVPYHVLRIEKSETKYLDYYLDTETYQIFKTVERDQGNPKYIYEEVFYKGYRPQAGINMPMEFEVRDKEGTKNIVISNVTLGHGVPNSFFVNTK